MKQAATPQTIGALKLRMYGQDRKIVSATIANRAITTLYPTITIIIRPVINFNLSWNQ
jgi:hypothetical protein